jgi:hypothetical protein
MALSIDSCLCQFGDGFEFRLYVALPDFEERGAGDPRGRREGGFGWILMSGLPVDFLSVQHCPASFKAIKNLTYVPGCHFPLPIPFRILRRVDLFRPVRLHISASDLKAIFAFISKSSRVGMSDMWCKFSVARVFIIYYGLHITANKSTGKEPTWLS